MGRGTERLIVILLSLCVWQVQKYQSANRIKKQGTSAMHKLAYTFLNKQQEMAIA